MSRPLRSLSLLTLFVVGLSVPDAWAQRPGGPGGPGGFGGPGRQGVAINPARMMALRAFDIETIWTDLSFRITLSDVQLASLRSTLQPMWKNREQLMADAQKTNDWEWLQDQLKPMKAKFEEKLKTVLTEDQQKEYTRLEQERQKRFEEQRGRFFQGPPGN